MKTQSLYEAIHDASIKNPNALAIYYNGKKISFRKLDKLICKTAAILKVVLGVKKGDVILIAQPNIPDTLILFYAVSKLGAISNMVHPFTPFNKISEIMRKTNTKYAFLFEQRVAKEVDKYRELKDKIFITRVENYLPPVKKLIYHFLNRNVRKKLGKHFRFKGFNYFHELSCEFQDCNTVSNISFDPAVMLHSGSTTGEPKTIVLSSHSFNFSADHALEYLSVDENRIKGAGMLSVLPSFHGFGLCMTMHAPLYNGFATVLIPKFSSDVVVKTMKRTRIDCIIGVPTMYESLLKNEKFRTSKYLKNIICAFCGGDAMNISLKERFDAVMENNKATGRLFEGYGLTESISVVLVNTFNHNKPGSIGYPSSGMDFKIIDDNDKEVSQGEIGEIIIKSPTNMIKYHGDEDATKYALLDGGWLRTGDLGYIDEDGFVFFKQRKKRVVKVSGVGVFPTEIENLIQSVQGVKEVCAISIPDDRLISAIKVFVVADYFDEEEMRQLILEKCRKYLIRWAVPKEIEFRKDLPLTMLGKVNFRQLQDEENKKRGLL